MKRVTQLTRVQLQTCMFDEDGRVLQRKPLSYDM